MFAMLDAPSYPGARPAERQYDFDAQGQRLRVYEWGDRRAQPLVLCHGYWDNAHGFDLLAPRLAEHYRVVAFDTRGHGDSAWVDSYTWPHMVYDIVHVLEHVASPKGVNLIGHSFGGSLATEAAIIAPHLIRKLINIEGFGPGTVEHPLPGQGDPGEFGSLASFRAFLDQRRKPDSFVGWRAYSHIDQLVARRKRVNPRLSDAWLRYFCWHGSRHSADGWRWKADPELAASASPFKIEWVARTWQHLKLPMLAIIADEADSWGPLAAAVLDERLGRVAQLERASVPGTGHFPHMEQPEATAKLLLEYLNA